MIVFVLSYLLVMTEGQTLLRESKLVMLGTGIIWAVIGLAVVAACAFSLAIAGQVLTFRT